MKEVPEDVITCSCHACLSATMAMAPFHGTVNVATRLTSLSHNLVSIVLYRSHKADFFCRRVIPQLIHVKTTKSYHRQLVWFISHIESQCSMVGFAMDGHIRCNYFLMSSLKWAQQVYILWARPVSR